MALRDAASTAARMTAGFWTEVARTMQPPQPKGTPASARPAPAETPEPAAPADGVLVPLDTWTRMMDQLGHLHEAGQELAEARERAARAETQVEFLREQLSDAKAKAKPAPRPRKAPAAAATTASAPSTAPATASPLPPTSRGTLIRTASRTRVANVRNRVSGWISAD